MANYLGAELKGHRHVEPPRVLIDAVSYTLDRTYGPGTSFRLRSGITPTGAGPGTESGRHTPHGPSAGDFQIFDADGNQMAGQALVPLAQNWVANFGSIGVNMYPGEKGTNFTHLDFVTPSAELKGRQDQFWTYPRGALATLDPQIQSIAGKQVWTDGKPADDIYGRLSLAANYLRETSVGKADPNTLANFWGGEPFAKPTPASYAPVTPANLSPANETSQSVAASPEDVRTLAGVMYAEARGEGKDGMTAVGQVAVNRLASGKYGSTLTDVLTQPDQFAAPIYSDDPNNPVWQNAVKAAEAVVNGTAPNIVGDAEFFYNPETANKAAARQIENAAKGTPSVTIGNHKFLGAVTRTNAPIESIPPDPAMVRARVAARNAGEVFGPMPEGVANVGRSPAEQSPIEYAAASLPDETFAPVAPLDVTATTGAAKGAEAFGALPVQDAVDLAGTASMGTPRGASAFAPINLDPASVPTLNGTATGLPPVDVSAPTPPFRPQPFTLSNISTTTGQPPGASAFAPISVMDAVSIPAGSSTTGAAKGARAFGSIPLSGGTSQADLGLNVALDTTDWTGQDQNVWGGLPGLKSSEVPPSSLAFAPIPQASQTATYWPASDTAVPPVVDAATKATAASWFTPKAPAVSPVISELTPPFSPEAALPPPAPVVPSAPPPTVVPAEMAPVIKANVAAPGVPGAVQPNLFKRAGDWLKTAATTVGNRAYEAVKSNYLTPFSPIHQGTSPVSGTKYVSGPSTNSGGTGGYVTQWTNSNGTLITTREDPYTGQMKTTYG